MSWWDVAGYKFLASEVQLVHEEKRYGGTLDIMAATPTETVLIDLKTSKGIYPDQFWQVAAYGELYRLSTGRVPSKYIICRIGKVESEGDFEVQERMDLYHELEIFYAALELYKKINKAKLVK